MGNYIEVDIIRYVKQGIESGTMIPRQAEKIGRIIARQGSVGETVVSWSVDAEGKEVKERVDQVSVDPQTNQPGWIVTKADEHGNVIIDNNGHPNEWIIADSVFKSKYEPDPLNKFLYRPKGGPQLIVQINDNIIFRQGNSYMKIAAGGYLNVTNLDKIYGISRRDFEDTYIFIDVLRKKKTKH